MSRRKNLYNNPYRREPRDRGELRSQIKFEEWQARFQAKYAEPDLSVLMGEAMDQAEKGSVQNPGNVPLCDPVILAGQKKV